MPKILERWLRGWNEVIEAPEQVADCAGVRRFEELILDLGLSIDELAHSLKVPAQTLRDLYETKGYVSGDAINNIRAYVEAKHALQDYVARQRGPSDSGD